MRTITSPLNGTPISRDRRIAEPKFFPRRRDFRDFWMRNVVGLLPRGVRGQCLPMTILRFALAPLALIVATGAAPKPHAAPLPDVVRIGMTTSLGVILIDLDTVHAPITTRNFVAYVDQHRLDGTTFYRVMRLPWGTPPNGLIQAGPRGDPKRVLKPIAHESTAQTGLHHDAGTISMARLAPGTATGDFTIMVSDMRGLDAGGNSGDPAGYAAFGRVAQGMDVVRKIYDAPLSPTLGAGIMRGQMVAQPVKIISVKRIAVTAAPAVTLY